MATSLVVRLTGSYNRGQISFLGVLKILLRALGDALLLVVVSILCLVSLSPRGMDYQSFFFSLGTSVMIQDVYPNGGNLHYVRDLMAQVSDWTLCQEFELRCGANDDEATWDPSTIPLVSKVLLHQIDERRVPLRIYYPYYDKKKVEGGLPSLLWLHGGGFVLGSAEADDYKSSLLANQTGFAVVSVDYSLAPESPFPGPVDDVHKALNWLLYSEEARDAFGLRSDQVFIGGESAGGTLAAAAVAMKEDHPPSERERVYPKGLLLIYPPLDQNFTNPSYHEHMHVNGALTGDQMIHFWRLYQGEDAKDGDCNGGDHHLCPILTPSHLLDSAHWPRTWIHLAKYDVLYHEGLAYAERLRSHDIPVEVYEYSTTIHGFFFSNLFPSHEMALNLATSQMLDVLHGKTRDRDFITKIPITAEDFD